MSIEKEINQKHFSSEFQKSVINVIYTSNWINEKMKNILDRFDITSQQFNILRILRGAGKPLSTMQIRQRMLDKMSDTSRIVDRMVKKELVQKVVCDYDKRLVDVSISLKGKQLLEELDKYQDEIDGLLKNLTVEDAVTLNTLLDKIRNAEKSSPENL
ncbi:MAG TPA: MarR family transcriptional regulator [Chitinophagaceae bacterium]|jgi:DNA-binding MarR family transcriptional regulator|nr:MarR family transcriptional regulator [Chitinophagaceae bacterium]